MASRWFSNLQVLGRGIKILEGCFVPASGSSTAADPNAGTAVSGVSGSVGMTFTRIASGSYLGTLDDKYVAIHGLHVQFAPSGSGDGAYVAERSIVAVPEGNFVEGSGGTNKVKFALCQMSGSNSVKAGTPVDVGNNAPYSKVFWSLIVKNTSVKQ